MIAGVKQVLKALAARQAVFVLLAADADAHIKNKVNTAAASAKTEVRRFSSKAELGEMLGLDVPCAVAAKPNGGDGEQAVERKTHR